MVGYGGMLMESLVAVMALIAACVLTPGTYFAINAPAAFLGVTPESAAHAIANWGFTFDPTQFRALTAQMQEQTLLSRTGGAPSLAVGMAALFSKALGGAGTMALWYHFAIMFEALFILTTLDAGTRVGRYMLQDLGRHAWEPFGRVTWTPAVVASSAIFAAMWGHFLYQGVLDPLGGINSLWPLFGISNQLLAAVALCVGTTIIIRGGKARYGWVTGLPLAWLTVVTLTAGWQKIFAGDPRLGFLAHAASLSAAEHSANTARLIFNDYLDVSVAAFFMASFVVILAYSAREWYRAIIHGTIISTEVPYQPRTAFVQE
jgi:carbon starvation protein